MTEVPNFISIYDDAISHEECKQIVQEFESNKKLQTQGYLGSKKLRPDVKKSIDITYHIDEKIKTSTILCKSLIQHIKLYKEEYPSVNLLLQSWKCYDLYNVQKYEPKGGYFGTHCEAASTKNSDRVLVWMFYLNTVPNGGTIFPTYNITTDAVEGRLVLWPPYWTHGHRGQICDTHTKYIATGWCNLVSDSKSGRSIITLGKK